MSYAILGGGISGLTAAFYLHNFRSSSKILLIEGSSRLGGWINSYKNENGTLFEQGPRTLRVPGNAGANTLLLAQMLNLEDKIIPISYDHISARNRLIKVNSKLTKFPNSFKSSLTKLPPFSKPFIRYLFNDLFAPAILSNDESFYSFVCRRFGSDVAKYALDPLCRGIFAGNARDLSVMALGNRIYALEQKYNSVIKGFIFDKNSEKFDPTLSCSLVDRARKEKWSVWSLEGGLQTLVDTIETQLQKRNVEILKETKILQVKKMDKFSIITNQKTYTVDKVISCLPAIVLKNLVRGWNYELYSVLNNIPFASVGLVNLEYSDDLIKEPGFGYLVPSCESNKVLGVIYDTCSFPQDGKTVFTVMMGGYWFKEHFGQNPVEETFLSVALDEIRSTFHINTMPQSYKVSILKNCIPQYTVGHNERVANARKLLDGCPLYLGGNSYDGVGVNDAIYNTKKIIQLSV